MSTDTGDLGDEIMALLEADYTGRRRKVNFMGKEIWVQPMNLGEFSTIQHMHPNDDALRNAEIMIRVCRTEDGKRVFNKNHKQRFKDKAAWDRIGPIISALASPSVDDAEKN